ncbi:MAG: thioredoxin domain-containing protein [Candidatus Andersenbacteria bacterium]|nr:thioredoxin domain-containing protein [Candidatus Andersenbacteria bacterium]MBI3250822.1 thioredoxin domain-containing protein [Candidatus Andersenbacteria bacterium]
MDQNPSNKSSVFGVPAAIVIAGGLIAAALYFGNSKASVQQVASGQQAANPQAAQPAAQPPEPTIGAIRPITDQDHIRGAKNARVTILEYSDLECPFCKKYHPTVQQALSEYPNDVRWVYRHSPLSQLHSQAAKEAEATECAGEQGKFWEMTDKIFEVTPSNNGLNLADLPKLAQQVGVANIPQFQSCLDSGKYTKYVADDTADAQVAGLQGTPYSVIIAANGQKFPLSGAQPYSALKQLIDQALKSK